MDKNKLIKFLNLSTSLNDGEALSAIRKANIFLKENNLNWETIFVEKSSENNKDLQTTYWKLKKTEQNSKETSEEFRNRLKFATDVSKYLIVAVIVLIFLLIIK
jgi:hypothetical protein